VFLCKGETASFLQHRIFLIVGSFLNVISLWVLTLHNGYRNHMIDGRACCCIVFGIWDWPLNGLSYVLQSLNKTIKTLKNKQ